MRRRQSLPGGLGDTRALCSTERSTMRTSPGKTATVITRELPAGSGGTTGAVSSTPPAPSPSLEGFQQRGRGCWLWSLHELSLPVLVARGRFLLLPPRLPQTKLPVAVATATGRAGSWQVRRTSFLNSHQAGFTIAAQIFCEP